VLVLDMIEILPPLEKYKYNTLRILPVKCYIDNFVCLQCYIQNVNSAGGVPRGPHWSRQACPYAFCHGGRQRPTLGSGRADAKSHARPGMRMGQRASPGTSFAGRDASGIHGGKRHDGVERAQDWGKFPC
jgi:hypothetical protein